SNRDGQVGGGGDVATRAIRVSDLDGAVELALGGSFSCARMKDGTVKCWGTGQILGDGKDVSKSGVQAVSGIAGAAQVEADGLLACARLESGAVKCWGIAEVVAPAFTDAIDVKVAETHGCALLKSGAVKCWGADGGWGGKGP